MKSEKALDMIDLTCKTKQIIKLGWLSGAVNWGDFGPRGDFGQMKRELFADLTI